MKKSLNVLLIALLSLVACDSATAPEETPAQETVLTPKSSSSGAQQFTLRYATKDYYFNAANVLMRCDASKITITGNVNGENTLLISGYEYCSYSGESYNNNTLITNLEVITAAGVTEDGVTFRLFRGYEQSTQMFIFIQWFGEYGANGDFRFWYENCMVAGTNVCNEEGNSMFFHYHAQ